MVDDYVEKNSINLKMIGRQLISNTKTQIDVIEKHRVQQHPSIINLEKHSPDFKNITKLVGTTAIEPIGKFDQRDER